MLDDQMKIISELNTEVGNNINAVSALAGQK